MNDIKKLLERPRFIAGVKPSTRYERQQCDNDGDPLNGVLDVLIGIDGDTHIAVRGATGYIRFRNSTGGGRSPRVHNALLILAEAIRLDNTEGRCTT